MKHAEEADLCAELSRITSDLLKSLSAGAEEKAVQDALVLQCQGSQFTW
jgi:hypothetical protein